MGVSPARITRWAADGMPVAQGGGRGREGRYDVAACQAWKAARDAANTNSNSLAQERAKLAAAQRRKTELDIRRREGELLEAAEVERAWSGIVIAIRTKLLALPRALAQRLAQAAQAGGAGAVERELTDVIREVLTELATVHAATRPAVTGGA